jgi:hypothetical protein
MYKSIEQIKKLRTEKHNILKNVYQSNNPDDIYKKQSALGSMSISIFTDAANAIMPALQEDGVSNVVWSNISLRLNKLSFISVPTASEIREKYNQSVANPTVVRINGAQPNPGTKINIKKIPIPVFLLLLAAQGIAVPLLFNSFGGSKWALVKICAINALAMVIEVVGYFNLLPAKSKKTRFAPAKEASASMADYDVMYRRAIQEVYRDNRKKLDDWFDTLEKIATEEIAKALGKAEE